MSILRKNNMLSANINGGKKAIFIISVASLSIISFITIRNCSVFGSKSASQAIRERLNSNSSNKNPYNSEIPINNERSKNTTNHHIVEELVHKGVHEIPHMMDSAVTGITRIKKQRNKKDSNLKYYSIDTNNLGK